MTRPSHVPFKRHALLGAAISVLLSACSPETPEESAERTSAPQAEPAPPVDAAPPVEAAPQPVALPAYVRETVIPGGPFHGIHGLAFDGEGRLLVGSVVGQAIYEVDPETGENAVFIAPPEGMADDIEEGPDGTLVWTAFSDGKVYARAPGGAIVTVAEGLPGTNSLAFAPDGRLFFTQVFAGDALYEGDPTGATPPRKIMEGMGGLNGFDFGPDGKLYGPLWFKGQVVRVDVDAATLETVAEGFTIPAAVNFNSQGVLHAVDTAEGQVVRVDIESGERTVIAQVPKAIDNLTFSADDRLFLTVMAENAVYEVDTGDGSVRKVVSSPLANAADIALVNRDGAETLYVATAFALSAVDLASGEMRELGRVFDQDALVDYPLALGVDPDGGADGAPLVAVGSFASSTIQLFDAATEALGPLFHDRPAIADVLPHDGAVLVLDVAAGALKRVSGEDYGEVETLAEGLTGPVSMVMGPGGAVYVSEYAGLISRIDLASGERTVIAEGLQGPEGLAFAGEGAGPLAGKLIVAEVAAQAITAIDLETGERATLARDLPIGLPAATSFPPMNLTTGIAVTQDGDVLFASDLDSAVYRLTAHEAGTGGE